MERASCGRQWGEEARRVLQRRGPISAATPLFLALASLGMSPACLVEYLTTVPCFLQDSKTTIALLRSARDIFTSSAPNVARYDPSCFLRMPWTTSNEHQHSKEAKQKSLEFCTLPLIFVRRRLQVYTPLIFSQAWYHRHAPFQNLHIGLQVDEATLPSCDKKLHLTKCCGGSANASSAHPQGGRHRGGLPKREWTWRPEDCMSAFPRNPVSSDCDD